LSSISREGSLISSTARLVSFGAEEEKKDLAAISLRIKYDIQLRGQLKKFCIQRWWRERSSLTVERLVQIQFSERKNEHALEATEADVQTVKKTS